MLNYFKLEPFVVFSVKIFVLISLLRRWYQLKIIWHTARGFNLKRLLLQIMQIMNLIAFKISTNVIFIRIKSRIRHVLYNFLKFLTLVTKLYPFGIVLNILWKLDFTLFNFSLTPPSSWCRTIPAKVRQQAKESIVMLQKSSCAHSFLDEVSVLFSVKNKKQQTKAYGLIRLVFIRIV